MLAGQMELVEHVHLLPGSFIQVGGVFTAIIHGVSLVTGRGRASFFIVYDIIVK